MLEDYERRRNVIIRSMNLDTYMQGVKLLTDKLNNWQFNEKEVS